MRGILIGMMMGGIIGGLLSLGLANTYLGRMATALETIAKVEAGR